MKNCMRTWPRKYFVIALVYFLLTLNLKETGFAQVEPSASAASQYVKPLTMDQILKLKVIAEKLLTYYYAWASAPWLADDRPYASIRTQIDGQIQRGTDPGQIFDQWDTDWAKDPENTQLVFGRAYAANQLMLASDLKPETNTFDQGTGRLNDAKNAFYDFGFHYRPRADQVGMPPSYNVARLTFFNGTMEFENHVGVALGDRILKQDPLDKEVQFYMIQQLAYSGSKSDYDRAHKMAKTFVAANPNSPRALIITEILDESLANHMRSLAQFDKAIADSDRVPSAYPSGSIGEANAKVAAMAMRNRRAWLVAQGWH